MDCPSVQLVQAYGEGAATREERALLEAHARSCRACRDLLALSGTADSREVVEGQVLEVGTVIGGFVIDGVLGAGAMGVVYGARDPALDRRVALKLLREESPDRRERFTREGKALARVTHANVCGVYEIGEHEGRLFIAMEHVDGSTLGQWLRESRRTPREILPRFAAAARGLAAAHEAGVVHRDFKPDNVLLGKDGRVRVSDFGLAGWIATAESGVADGSIHVTHAGTVMGTPIYMSPEQHAGGLADERSDQFSLAAALFHALYGVAPFAGNSLDELGAHARAGALRERPAGSGVSRRLDRVVRRALSPRPADRFPSMTALAAELDRPAGTGWRWLGAAAAIAGLALVGALMLPSRDATHRCLNGDGPACLVAAEAWRTRDDLAAAGPRLAELYQRGCDASHLPSCTELAHLYQQGLGVPLALERAHPLLLRACDGGEPAACASLGEMYETGEPIAPDPERAAAAYERSCAGKHGPGCVLRGGLRRRGLGLPEDRQAALADYRLGCELGSARGCSQAAELIFDRPGAAIEEEAKALAARAKQLAQAGCRRAVPDDCLVLGLDGLRAWSGSRDFGAAAAAQQRGCDAGGGHSCKALGRLYLTGLGVPIDAPRGRALYERGCRLHDADACASWGIALGEAMGGPAEPDQARAVVEELCARRVPMCWPLGRMYAWGHAGLAADPARALELYKLDCGTRFEHAAEACGKAGRYHAPDGKGPLDPVQESALLTRGCYYGNEAACADLATVDLREGRAHDAFLVLERTCRSAAAQCQRLAILYLDGTGTEKNVPRGVEILEKACAVGEGDACHQLGTLHLDGKYLPVNVVRALDFFEKGCAAFESPPCLAAAAILDGSSGLAAQPERAADLRRIACERDPTLCPDAGSP